MQIKLDFKKGGKPPFPINMKNSLCHPLLFVHNYKSLLY